MKQIKTFSGVAVFGQKKIRKVWDEEKELWYFSVVDVIEALTDSNKPRDYWFRMKDRVKTEEGLQLSTNCRQLKLTASDGKNYLTDCANTENVFRIIESIPSPKAEPFKRWLARIGYERIEETVDPEKAIHRALNSYLKQGRTPEWVNLRLKSIEIRKDLTDEWQERGVNKGDEFAILTDDITYAWAGLSTKQYKKIKDLKKENLRDNMTNLELVLNMLAEASTTEISKVKKPKDFPENRKIAREGGGVAGVARKEIENKTGRSVISGQKYIR